jgi:ribose transport system substrate-binding protein
MKKLRVLVALPNDNMYQHEQAAAAKAAGARLGVEVQVVHADNDAVTQSQQVLEAVQSKPESRPDAIVVEPLTKIGLPRVAEAAVAAGIGWVVSNCDVEYIGKLRKISDAPVFSVNQQQSEVGRLEGRQIAALLPQGGSVLYVQGPSTNSVSVQRRNGMESAKPQNIHISPLWSKWSVERTCEAVSAWLRLAIARAEKFSLIVCQSNDLALGARRAFQNLELAEQRDRWLSLPFLGIGIFHQSKILVDTGPLSAAVITSVTTPRALEMLVRAVNTRVQPPEHILMEVSSYPALEVLAHRERKS